MCIKSNIIFNILSNQLDITQMDSILELERQESKAIKEALGAPGNKELF